MRKISLRIRITLFVGTILVLLTIALTSFSIWNLNRYFVTPLVPLTQGKFEEIIITPLTPEQVKISPLPDSNAPDNSQPDIPLTLGEVNVS